MGNTTYTSGLLINSCQIISAHQYSEVLNYQNLVCIQTATCVGLINDKQFVLSCVDGILTNTLQFWY